MFMESSLTTLAALLRNPQLRPPFVGPGPLVVVFVLDLAEVDRKHAARATRFAVQPAGHAARNVERWVAADWSTGHVLGGGLDRGILGRLALAHTRARHGGAVACGR